MRHRIVILMFLFGVYLQSTGKFIIFCEYGNYSYHRSLYACVATPGEMCNKNCTDIVAEGKHLYGKTDADVHAFVMENRNITELPRNLGSVFPNILFINFNRNLITNLTTSDIKQFPKLEMIKLTNNKISGIYENIFKQLPLTHIEIDNNYLEYVFEGLTYSTSLDYLNFKNNKCIDMVASSPDGIDHLKDKLLLRCSLRPRTKQLESDVVDIKKQDEISNDRVRTLEKVIHKLKEALTINFQ